MQGLSPNRYVVIIALGDLHEENGLPELGKLKTLASGQDITLTGDDEVLFRASGGGMAMFLVLNL